MINIPIHSHLSQSELALPGDLKILNAISWPLDFPDTFQIELMLFNLDFKNNICMFNVCNLIIQLLIKTLVTIWYFKNKLGYCEDKSKVRFG